MSIPGDLHTISAAAKKLEIADSTVRSWTLETIKRGPLVKKHGKLVSLAAVKAVLAKMSKRPRATKSQLKPITAQEFADKVGVERRTAIRAKSKGQIKGYSLAEVARYQRVRASGLTQDEAAAQDSDDIEGDGAVTPLRGRHQTATAAQVNFVRLEKERDALAYRRGQLLESKAVEAIVTRMVGAFKDALARAPLAIMRQVRARLEEDAIVVGEKLGGELYRFIERQTVGAVPDILAELEKQKERQRKG